MLPRFNETQIWFDRLDKPTEHGVEGEMTAKAPLNLEADLIDRGRCNRHKVTTWQLAQYVHKWPVQIGMHSTPRNTGLSLRMDMHMCIYILYIQYEG
jgi:hypothetical protein